MSVDYRLLRADEVDAACDMWMEVYPDSLGHEAWRREFLSIPQHLEHTRVAVAQDGMLLSTVHYWLRHIRDVNGTPLRVGGLSHVVTRAKARRQGHAARLMESTLAAMREDGCAWSLLFTTEEGRPLYEHCGWRTHPRRHLRQGTLSGRQLDLPATYTSRRYDPAREPGGWTALAQIHAAYNASRPLTTVRDAAYWRFMATTVGNWLASVDAAVFVVWRQGEEDHPCACAFAGFGEGRFGLHEVGALRGDEEALPMLLSAVAERAGGRGSKGRLCLPREQPIDAALAVLFDDLEQPIDDEPMARAIAPDFDGHRIDALFAAPGAITWMLDDF